jgi:aspartyl aminopeptidase
MPVEPIVQEMLDYLNESWTAFHAVHATKRWLVAAGYVELDEQANWALEPGGRYFFTRNMSTLMAFAVGGAAKPGCGFTVVGAHTDSPCPKLKPVSKLTKGGYLQLSVAGYGGGLWHTWYDRDLSVAGRAIVRRPGQAASHELCRVDKPILRIPTLAVHLARENGTAAGFKFNLQATFP